MIQGNCKILLIMIGCFALRDLSAQSVLTTEGLVNATINAKGDLMIQPSTTSSQQDFDFFEGKWKVQHRKLKTRLSNSSEWIEYQGTNEDFKMLRGIGHTNNVRATIDGKTVEGVSLRLFNPKTKLWSVYWASSADGKLSSAPIVGSFEKSIGRFYGKEIVDGKPVMVMAKWDKTDPDNPIWSQAFSTDNGKTWEWNWYMTHTRVVENDLEAQQKLLTFDNTIEIPKLNFNESGELVIRASATSSPHDFDLLKGKWKMVHRRLKERLVKSNEWVYLESMDENYGAILNGLGNTDLYKAVFDGVDFEGFTLRLFNPQTKLWSLYWVASNSGVLDPPVVGSFENDIGHFFCKDTFKGVEVIVLFRWDMRDKEHPVWSQAFSPDNGKTWEWNWINVSYRLN
jgi:hypothetical protein